VLHTIVLGVLLALLAMWVRFAWLFRRVAALPDLRREPADAPPAGGDWILFTDADVLFAPGALRRSVAWVERERLGHGVALPHFIAPGWWERAFVSLFGLLLLVAQRADDLRRARSRGYIGVGAFNLVRRDAYLGIGGHTRLRLEVADDLKLGLVLRRSGVRQGCADSGGLVSVRWQHGFRASMRGLLKNFFAGAEYRWRGILRIVIGLPLATTFPAAYLVWALARGSLGAAAGVAALAWVISTALLADSARRFAFGRGPEGLLLPVMGPCVAGVALASALGTTVRKGIVWRGTRYALSDLKAGVVSEAHWPTDNAPG
jgi:Glycosyl transferase family 21